ncbi:MAG: hypothetical protein JW929_06280 [Anaerolineales bacterium]|nr:hypothetical protein [Anaerolineales bacterium]
MITLFAVPKAMEGEFALLQENAVGSWIRLGSAAEILLFGGERGVDSFARRTGIDHIADVARTEFGTPRVDDLFRRAETVAARPLLGYINADIILGGDFVDAVRTLSAVEGPFLAVGRRWDLDVKEAIDYSDPAWEEKLRRRVERQGSLHAETGIDYFIFRPGLWKAIPPFAIGRTMWDNWLILEARRRRAPVIDATRGIWAVHQNHGYNHHPQGAEGVWKGPEAERNEQLAGGSFRLFNVLDATHRLAGGRIAKIDDPEHRKRERFMLPAISRRARWAESAERRIARIPAWVRRRLAAILARKNDKENA